jgi:hypothetical protein
MLQTGEIPFSLFNISSLIVINLNKNNLNGILPHEMCHQFPQLQMFTLHTNDYSGIIPRSIGNCTSLQYFSLADNFFEGIYSQFSSFIFSYKFKQ